MGAKFPLLCTHFGKNYDLVAVLGISTSIALPQSRLNWNPRSATWVSVQAVKAAQKGDTAAAKSMARRALAMGAEPAWAWRFLALIAMDEHNDAEFNTAISQLKTCDRNAADELVKEYKEGR